MTHTSLEELFPDHVSGYWGKDAGLLEHDVRVVRNGDILPEGNVRWDELPMRSVTAKERDKSLLQAGDLLLTTSGNCARVAWIGDHREPTCASNFTRRLRPNPRVAESRYLFHLMRSEAFRASCAPYIRGTTMENLSVRDAFPAVTLPLPPLDRQRRIAALLDAADDLRAKRKKALAKLDNLTQAIFVDMFGDASSFVVERLGDVVRTTSGGTPSRKNPAHFQGQIPWVKSGELAGGLVTKTEECITQEAIRSSSAKVMPAGTVLLAMYGATTGAVATLGIEASTNQAVCCLSPNDRVAGPYLHAFLAASKPELLRKASGGAQPNISHSIIRDLAMPVPPLELQHQFAGRLAGVQQVRIQARRSSETLDAVSRSLRQRAFAGEL